MALKCVLGRGYLFRGEEEFQRDLKPGLRDLAVAAGMDAAARELMR